MKLLAPRDNALFMASWRERMRPTAIFSAAAVSAIVIALVIISCYMSDERENGLWPTRAVGLLAVVQGITLLAVGSFSAGQAAARERTSGTLEFHRTSPTKRTDQVLGLILGAPCLEWCVFAGMLPVLAALWIGSRVRLGTFVQFQASLVLTALFLHSAAVVAGLWRGGGKAVGKGSAVGVVPALALFILTGMAEGMEMSSLYHATNLPAYERLLLEAFARPWNPVPEWPDERLVRFCFVSFPSIVLQLLVQAPFAVIAFVAARRIISRPERPALSKLQSLACVALVVFFVLGGALSVAGREYAQYNWHVKAALAFFLYLAMAAALWGAWVATPTHLLHVKGLRRARKLGRRRLGPVDDGASNRTWLAACLLVLAVSYAAFVPYLQYATSFQVVAGALVVMCYVAWFAGGLEFYRLSRFRAKKGLFGIGVAVPWIFVPALGLIGLGFGESAWYSRFLLAFSPVTGLAVLTDAMADGRQVWASPFLRAALAVNLALAVGMLYLAARERGRVARDELTPTAGGSTPSAAPPSA